MLKAVIFDLYGTLLYTIKDITAALNRGVTQEELRLMAKKKKKIARNLRDDEET